MSDKHNGWTKYHIITKHGGWKFFREGMKRSITTNQDRNVVIKESLYKVAHNGGLLVVHYSDGTVDFVVDNWIG